MKVIQKSTLCTGIASLVFLVAKASADKSGDLPPDVSIMQPILCPDPNQRPCNPSEFTQCSELELCTGSVQCINSPCECRAIFYDENDNEITCPSVDLKNNDGESSNDTSDDNRCEQFVSCEEIRPCPGAITCENDYESCMARFYDESGNETCLRDDSEDIDSSVDENDTTANNNQERSIGYCETDADCSTTIFVDDILRYCAGGVCLPVGECQVDTDCWNSQNMYAVLDCVGYISCDVGVCSKTCAPHMCADGTNFVESCGACADFDPVTSCDGRAVSCYEQRCGECSPVYYDSAGNSIACDLQIMPISQTEIDSITNPTAVIEDDDSSDDEDDNSGAPTGTNLHIGKTAVFALSWALILQFC